MQIIFGLKMDKNHHKNKLMQIVEKIKKSLPLRSYVQPRKVKFLIRVLHFLNFFGIFSTLLGPMSVMSDASTPSNGGKQELMDYANQVSSHLPPLDGVGLSDMIDIDQDLHVYLFLGKVPTYTVFYVIKKTLDCDFIQDLTPFCVKFCRKFQLTCM